VLIIAGALYVEAADRDRYLSLTFDVARVARGSRGCLDFVQAADPLDASRINVYERWESDADLQAFRTSDPDAELDLPEMKSASVSRYLISSVESP
jgi:quinol monooxygenase YgiN